MSKRCSKHGWITIRPEKTIQENYGIRTISEKKCKECEKDNERV